LNNLPAKKENYLHANIYKLWATIEEKGKNYREALGYHKQYSRHLASILKENKNKAVLEIQSKYDFVYNNA